MFALKNVNVKLNKATMNLKKMSNFQFLAIMTSSQCKILELANKSRDILNLFRRIFYIVLAYFHAKSQFNTYLWWKRYLGDTSITKGEHLKHRQTMYDFCLQISKMNTNIQKRNVTLQIQILTITFVYHHKYPLCSHVFLYVR